MKELKELDYISAAHILRCEVAAIKAVCEVEAPRGGYYKDGRVRILYEPFVFGGLTNHKFDNYVVQIDDVNYPLSLKGVWSLQRAMYGRESIQHEKLEAAKKLDATAAIKSCSWGKFQILAANHVECGYNTAEEFVEAMQESERAQLYAFANFVKFKKIDDDLRSLNWAGFAKVYNGPGYAKNKYDVKLAEAYKKYSGQL